MTTDRPRGVPAVPDEETPSATEPARGRDAEQMNGHAGERRNEPDGEPAPGAGASRGADAQAASAEAAPEQAAAGARPQRADDGAQGKARTEGAGAGSRGREQAGGEPVSAGGGGRSGGGSGAGSGPKRSAAAEALAAAVRAVESGERPAASFFTESGRPAAPATGAASGAASGGQAPDPASGAAAGSAPERGARPGAADAATGAGHHRSAAGAGDRQSPSAAGPGGPGHRGDPYERADARSADAAGHAAMAANGQGQHAGAQPSTDPAGGSATAGSSRTAGPRPGTVHPELHRQDAPVREVLGAGGAPEALAGPVLGVLGEQAAQVLREDPWQLLAVPGVRPEQADSFARALLGQECGPGDERRAQALVQWLLERAALAGHTALEPAAMTSALAQQSVPDPDGALRTAIADGAVLVFQDALDEPGAARTAGDGESDDAEEQPVRVLLGLDRYALAEESLADGLGRLKNTFVPERGAASPQPGAAVGGHAEAPSAADWETAAESVRSSSAAELIRAVAGHGLVAHTGGEAARAEPAAVVAAARALGLRAWAATHSEDARLRVATLIDAAAAELPAGAGRGRSAVETGHDGAGAGAATVTVAGLLDGREGPGRDEDGALALDVLVVLDAPQLDVETAAALVESLPDGVRLVLSGDPGVLWSAGPGRVFADLLASRTCPHVASRTPDPGPIGELVSGIGVGELAQVDAPGKEVVIVPVRDAGEAVHRTVQLVADSVPRAIGVPAEGTQVITPGHGGSAGTRALNAALKERLNPGPGRFGGFDPGDRVAYVPAPGRTQPGTVIAADVGGLRLECAGAEVVVEPERVSGAVRHGWALTAHQAAGMRWPAVVVVLPGDATDALSRSWVYTAFSRAERHLSVVHGADQALPRAVAEVPVKERTTRLRTLLETLTPPAG